MTVKDFLKSRKSSRDFKERTLATDELIAIERGLEEISREDKAIHLRLILDGKKIFDALNGHAGYSGVMIKSPHYVAVMNLTENPKERTLIALGMEECTSMLGSMNLASCYITLSDVPKDIMEKLFGSHFEKVEYLIAIGEPKINFPDLPKTKGSRFSVDEIVFQDIEGTPFEEGELQHRHLDEIFYFTSLAPSYKNLQPWRFIVSSNEVTLVTEKSEIHESTYVDLGIVMYYFERLAAISGHRGTWKLSRDEETLGKYEVVARYNL